MSDNLAIWNAVKQPPPTALHTINAGRLRGKTDINPQWRYKTMTEQFGVCGIGWDYEVARVWQEPAPDNQVFAFAEIKLYIKVGDEWSRPIPGLGGSMLIAKEKEGLHASDEGYKMAITDALSVAMKMLGIGADIYAGLWDGSKYASPQPEPTKYSSAPQKAPPAPSSKASAYNKLPEANFTEQLRTFWGSLRQLGWTPEKVHERLGVKSLKTDWIEKGRTLQEAYAEVTKKKPAESTLTRDEASVILERMDSTWEALPRDSRDYASYEAMLDDIGKAVGKNWREFKE